jgi:KaiC/GvpD/RAD55 family RecA-like ATPase
VKHAAFTWVDYARGDVRFRNCVVPIQDALAEAKSGTLKNSYITVYRFPVAYAERCRETGSVGGYDGPAYADYLPIDIDREGNLTAALLAARKLAYALAEYCDLDRRAVRYFFSGAKGFHLLLPTFLFGEVEPSPSLPRVFRGIAAQLAELAGEEIDLKIYDVNRLFRLPNTQHTSRLWKVELSAEELLTWDAERVREEARKGPREFTWTPPHGEANEILAELFAKEMHGVAAAPVRTSPAGDQGLAAAIACTVEPFYKPGERHNLILALSGYAAKRHVPRETMLGVVDELQSSDAAIGDPDNLPTAVNDTYDRVRRGDTVKGYRELERLMDAPDLAALRDILGDRSTQEDRAREAEAPAVKAAPQGEERVPVFDAMLGGVLDEFAAEKMAAIDATRTPWPSWNRACRGAGGGEGIARGWHVIVAARSGNGKSLVGANMAAHAIESGEPVAIISLEMSQIEMVTRVMAIVGRVPIADLEHGGGFRPEQWKLSKRRLHQIQESSGGVLYINRDTMRRLEDIDAAIRHLFERHGVRFFVVDYLQLAAIGKASELLDRVTEVSGVVRGLAKELRVTTVGMSQLNRESSKANETPRKEGLMGGSPLENDAEQVLLLDHSRVERAGSIYKRTPDIMSWAVLDKNRHGPCIEIPTYLDVSTLTMRERMPDELASGPAAA